MAGFLAKLYADLILMLLNQEQALQEYVEQTEEEWLQSADNGNGHHPETNLGLGGVDKPITLKIGDLCPECGQAAVVNEEGCRKCYACGYSEC